MTVSYLCVSPSSFACKKENLSFVGTEGASARTTNNMLANVNSLAKNATWLKLKTKSFLHDIFLFHITSDVPEPQ